MVDYSEDVYNKIVADYETLAAKVNIKKVRLYTGKCFKGR